MMSRDLFRASVHYYYSKENCGCQLQACKDGETLPKANRGLHLPHKPFRERRRRLIVWNLEGGLFASDSRWVVRIKYIGVRTSERRSRMSLELALTGLFTIRIQDQQRCSP